MIFRSNKGQSYQTEKELGKGGEGTVYTITGNSGTVLKLYNDPLLKDQFSKLQYMVSVWNSTIEKYTAWPSDIVLDSSNRPVGFIMRKLDNYYPLHMLFSPMDRKRLFADKGYNFLLHVARNLCSAFHALHQQKIIVGDINEGNILVNVKGMIAFIDCDSFQVKNGNDYYFCQVGIPRYTPPELLRQVSFNNIIRTEQTDSFSLGILIFQLLFLGRHPFAGKNNSQHDIDEDAAIRNHEFAYSLKNKNKRLSPPDAAFKIQYLPAALIDLFHRAFEHEQNRPLPDEWVLSIDNCIKAMKPCTVSKTHFYPGAVGFCPWCDFKNRLGIVYFWDNSFVDQLSSLGDLESFINGFKLEKIVVKELPDVLNKVEVLPQPIDEKYKKNMQIQIAVYAIIIVATAICFFYVTNWTILFGVLFWVMNKLSPWADSIEKELTRRKNSYEIFTQQYFDILNQYRSHGEVDKYNRGLPNLTKLIAQFRNLSEELQTKRRQAEELLYNSQLNLFLEQFWIKDFKIEMFGASKKLLLYNAGINTAADIEKLDSTYVKGIGPKNIIYLKSWKRQVQSGFVYQPDQQLLQQKFTEAAQSVGAKKLQLEAQLKKAYQELFTIKSALQLQQETLYKRYIAMLKPLKQAEADLEAFQKIANKYKLR